MPLILPVMMIRRRSLPIMIVTALALSMPAWATNRVLRLDGTGDHVELPAGVLAGGTEWTIEGWLRWDKWGWYSQPWGFGLAESGLMLNQYMTYPVLQLFVYDERQLHLLSERSVLRLGEWVHIAAVIDPSGMRLLVNGILADSSETPPGLTIPDGPVRNSLGRAHWSVNHDFAGDLDEVRVWEGARTPAQIRETIDRRLRGDEPGLRALWNFDGGDGTDATGHGFDGRLFGDAHCPVAPSPGPAPVPAVLSGTVTDRAGAPLAGVWVQLGSGGGASTDAGGRYRLSLLPRAEAEEVSVERGPLGARHRGVRLQPGGHRRLDIVVAPSVNLSGTARRLDGAAYASLLVQAVAADGLVAAATSSDRHGAFRFVNLPAGEYRVRAYGAGGYAYAMDATVMSVRTGAPERDGLDLRLAAGRHGSWRRLGRIDGLVHDEVNAVHQSADGYLYLATTGGMSRFDGKDITSFTIDDGLPESRLLAIHEAGDGQLWFASESAVTRYDGRSFTNLGEDEGLGSDGARDISGDGAGNVWFATLHGARRLEGTQVTTLQTEDGLANVSVLQVLEDRQGRLWFATDGGVTRMDEGGSHHLTTREGLAASPVHAMLEDRVGRLWFGSADGDLSFWDGAGLTRLSVADGWIGRAVRDIAEDEHGHLWIATEHGVGLYDGTGFVYFTTADGLADDDVHDVEIGSDGAIWFGTRGGLSQYAPRALVNYSTGHGLPTDALVTVTVDDDGAVWVGTKSHGAVRFDGERFHPLHHGDGMIADDVHDIFVDDGHLWFSTGAGVSRFDGEQFFNLGPGDVLGLSLVVTARRCVGDRLWFGMQGNGIAWYDGVGGAVLDVRDGLVGNNVQELFCDRDDRLWVGASTGASLYDGDRIQSFRAADGLTDGTVTSFAQTADGRMFFGTHRDGVVALDGGGFRRFVEADGLPDRHVNDLTITRDGLLVVGTQGGGLALYDGEAWSSLDRRDGLAGNAVYRVVEGPDRDLWLATSGGLTRYRRVTAQPRARVVSARTDRGKVDIAGPLTVPAGSRLTVEVGAVDFVTQPERRQFRYRLIAADGTAAPWTPPAPASQYEVTPSVAGDFVLQTQVIDRDLNRSAPARLALRVVLPWYDDAFVLVPLAVGALMLALTSTGLGFRYYRSRRGAARQAGLLVAGARVREQVWRMTDAADIDSVLRAVYAGVRDMGVRCRLLGINVIEMSTQERGTSYVMDGESLRPVERRMEGTDFQRIQRIWRTGQVVLRADLQAEDRHGEVSSQAEDGAARAEIDALRASRCLVEVPFSHGTLAASSSLPDAFSDADIEVLQRMAGVLSEGFRRLDDFRNLAAARDAAERANQAKSTFLANMSHEIRTPMNAILGYAQVLRRDELPPAHRQAMATIESSGNHLLALINDVLDLAKIESGRIELKERPLALPALVQELRSLFDLMCRERGLAFEVDVDSDLPVVLADGDRLRQILVNLLGNAVKFTDDGAVRLRVSRAADDRYRFVVEDTGRGIPPEVQRDIFAPFAQAAEGERRGGTGLGLSISRECVRLMGGELQLQSEPGRGATFFFELTLPETEQHSREASPTPTGRLSPGQRVRALVVDDLETNRDVLARMLESVGVEVRAVTGGPEALHEVRREPPDIVFLDVRMAGMDGLETLRQLRAQEGLGRLRVVAVSASVMEHERDSYAQAGFDGFVDKPFRYERMCQTMAGLLGVTFGALEDPSSEAGETAAASARGVRLPPDLAGRLWLAAQARSLSDLDRGLDELEASAEAELRALGAQLRTLRNRYDLQGLAELLKAVGDTPPA